MRCQLVRAVLVVLAVGSCTLFAGGGLPGRSGQPAKEGAEGKAGQALKKAVADLQGTWTLHL
jgi:hypothetical protein